MIYHIEKDLDMKKELLMYKVKYSLHLVIILKVQHEYRPLVIHVGSFQNRTH